MSIYLRRKKLTSVRSAMICGAIFIAASSAFAATTTQVDMSATPPDLTTSVDPNIVVTFDDSGSMTSHYMGDTRPFDGGGWGAPWGCAATVTFLGSDGASHTYAMNGVYYNPNTTYTPPIYETGTTFPNADATLAAVWADGIAVKRVTSPVTPAAASYINNPDSSSNGSDTRVAIINGTLSGTTDHRWTCGYGSYPTAFVDGTSVNTGGPYYYRFKSTVTVAVTSAGLPTNAGITTLYTASNWEAVRIAASQYQNVANWYAYYRTRNLMTRTSLSRVFAQFGGNVRVAWQNINTNPITSSTIITNINDTQTTPTAAVNYRQKFYDWIFATGASGGTPNRASTIRAGEFFKRTAGTSLTDPYWQPATSTTSGQELACRQNFHMLVTDGYWNEGDPTLPTGFFTAATSRTLPDGTAYSNSAAVSRIFWNTQGTAYTSSLANIAFYYWAQDLRPDLAPTTPATSGHDAVPTYVPDKTVGITSTSTTVSSTAPLSNLEVYFNPANDSASWRHVVQFMVTLGVAGKLQYSDNVDCNSPGTDDLCLLRKGSTNSSGGIGWPAPVNNAPQAIDDTWHAAINSRGSYFSASDPTSLVQHLTNVVNSILSRSASSTSLSPTMSVLTNGSEGFVAGYNSGDWSGTLYEEPLDSTSSPKGVAYASWEAGCKLTGGTFNVGAGTCTIPNPPLSQDDSRVILTSNDAGTASVPFRWSSLSTAQQNALNTSPTGTNDGYGQLRSKYIRGNRAQETTTPKMRTRASLLGAIVNSQPIYVSAPTSGLTDSFPTGTPEYLAAASGVSYSQFVFDNSKSSTERPPVVYVGADDGMLHAFSASNGAELWAYVPGMLAKNVASTYSTVPLGNINKLTQMTDASSSNIVPGVDDTPVVQDAFFASAWHSVLIGAMRMGGRGVFALDITKPGAVTEGNGNLLWEIDNTKTGFADLGYTFASQNAARITCNVSPCSGTGGVGGTWVAIVSSGYFPLPDQTPIDPASSDTASSQTSLFVIDLKTGTLIKELKTSSAPQFGSVAATYGLSTPTVYDLNNDLVDDIAVAGDLAGNLWRFDLSNPNPANWKVDLMFKTYTSASDVGRYPISVMPVGMYDYAASSPIFVFGTGKYLGPCDRTATAPSASCGPDSNSVTQAFFGIRDYGTAYANYPIQISQLQDQTLTQSGAYRYLTSNSVALTKRGWRIQLNPGGAEPGERAVVTITPEYSSNRAILTTLVPGTVSDPCTPGRGGAVMVVDAGSGGSLSGQAPVSGASASSTAGVYVVGEVVTGSQAIPLAGQLTAVTQQGGTISLPGLPDFSVSNAPPHRGAWRELLNGL